MADDSPSITAANSPPEWNLDHLSPEERVALAGIAPLREPQTGAEALLCTSRPEDARRVLVRGILRLARLREEASDLLEHMIEQLDRVDGDPDLEPSLARWASDNYQPDYRHIGEAAVVERQGCPEVDLEEDAGDAGEIEDGDEEPSLAAPEGSQNYGQRRCGWYDDTELQCEDEGHDSDTEVVSEDEGEPEYELCGWPSGDVDQTRQFLAQTLGYHDRGDLQPWWAPL